MKKESPSKPDTNVAPEPQTATAKTSQEQITLKKSVIPERPIVPSDLPKKQKATVRAGSWIKALALAGITCVLTLAVVETSPRQNSAQANAVERGTASPEESDSPSGHSVAHGSPTTLMDAPIRPSQAATITSHSRREAGSDDYNDVTVRKFQTEPAVRAGSSTDGQDSKDVFFDQDSAIIADQYRPALQQIADTLAKDPEASVILEGHTDASGSESYNLDLSNRRANAVREALINEFNVSSTQLTAMGSGSAIPIQPNSSAEGRAQNRRVSVRFAPGRQ